VSRFRCPRKWEKLQPVEGVPDVRRCPACAKDVTYFEKIEDACRHAAFGGRVTIGARVARRKDDLFPLYDGVTEDLLDWRAYAPLEPGDEMEA
jgi:hypothetical protein